MVRISEPSVLVWHENQKLCLERTLVNHTPAEGANYSPENGSTFFVAFCIQPNTNSYLYRIYKHKKDHNDMSCVNVRFVNSTSSVCYSLADVHWLFPKRKVHKQTR